MGLVMEPGVDVTVVPHLYDLKSDSTGMLALKGVSGNLVVCSWLFERAAHWILDRNTIHGQIGEVTLRNEELDDDDSIMEDDDDKERVTDLREKPNRKIYCLDLRISNKAQTYVEEIKRIQKENAAQLVGLGDLTGGLQADGPGHGADAEPAALVNRIESDSSRRWYPVIDYSRCTNCMECIDFCLFGVYGVDRIDTILVEEPDNCRKGCPACSRVCPENAIMFPQHKTPAIAGSNESAASMKIDLSQLFGAPQENKSAIEVASLERDEQLLMAGRDAVGLSVGIAKRQLETECQQRDELDDLVDELNDLDL